MNITITQSKLKFNGHNYYQLRYMAGIVVWVV